MAACIRAPKASEPYCLWKYGFPANHAKRMDDGGQSLLADGPLFPCHCRHGQDDEGHAKEFPEAEGEAEDEEGEKNGGQRLDG